MKKLIFVILAALLIGSCMKYGSDEVVPEVPDGFFQLKVANATLQGDTAYAAPNLYLKFWLDSLPETANNYSFAWNLGDGTTSVSPSPENLYQLGTYSVEVSIKNNNTGQTVERSLLLIVTNDFSFETSIILLEATPVAGGNYNYKLALKSTNIYNYANTTGPRWIIGDFTGWIQQIITEVIMINQIEYLVYQVVLPANEIQKQRFSYGRGSNWAFSPNSIFWKLNAQGEGAYEVHLTNGQMSAYPINSNNLPGDNGDVNNGDIVATIRNQIINGPNPVIRIYINYWSYANGSNPFITRLVSNNNWDPVSLTIINNGWGYKDYNILDLPNGQLFFRFGPNINQPHVFGIMHNSKYIIPQDNMLGLQVAQLKSGEWVMFWI